MICASGVGVGVGVGLTVEVGVAVDVGVAVAVGVNLAVGVTVGVNVAVGVTVGVGLGVPQLPTDSTVVEAAPPAPPPATKPRMLYGAVAEPPSCETSRRRTSAPAIAARIVDLRNCTVLTEATNEPELTAQNERAARLAVRR